jgi:hypothetical protein
VTRHGTPVPGTLTDIGGGFQGVVTPVNHAGGVVCSIRAARSAGELEVAPELVIIAAAGDELPEFTGMPDGRVCRVIWLRGYPDLDAPSRTGNSWQRRACPQRRGTRLIRTSMTSASGGVVVIGPSLLLQQIAARARAAGIDCLTALCLASNTAILGLLSRLGQMTTTPPEAEVIEVQINLLPRR